LKEILPVDKNFQGGEVLLLLNIGLFSEIEETHVSLERKPSVLET
jgi:hypothetical protein